MANTEKSGKGRIGELLELLNDPARHKEAAASLARFEATLDELMPWGDGSDPGYDRAARFSGGCGQWLVTKAYCEDRAGLATDEDTGTTWLERTDNCQAEYDKCVGS